MTGNAMPYLENVIGFELQRWRRVPFFKLHQPDSISSPIRDNVKSHEQAASERRREYERVRSIALCSHVNITISTHSCFLRIVCLSSCLSSNISSNLASQEAYFGTLYNNLYTINDVSLQSTIIIEMSEKATYPLKGGKMIHIHKRGEKKTFVSTSQFYQLITITSKLTLHITQNLNVVISNTFSFHYQVKNNGFNLV